MDIGKACMLGGCLICVLGIIFAEDYSPRLGFLGSLPDMYIVISEERKYCPPGNEVSRCDKNDKYSPIEGDRALYILCKRREARNGMDCKEWVIEQAIEFQLRHILLIGSILFFLGLYLVIGSKTDKNLANNINKTYKTNPGSGIEQFIHSAYGNPPPPKSAKLDEAIQLAYQNLLMSEINKNDVANEARSLNSGPIPYSTQDLALSVALFFFKQKELKTQLSEAQMYARALALEWLKQKKAAPLIVRTFENTLYKIYKPQN